ncbi:MAG: sigma-70 family RNA polymerase sigma factor [Bacteroidota bacterium]
MKEKDQEHIIGSIRQGDKQALHSLYLKHRVGFTEWAQKRYNCTAETATDIYQESIIVMYENIVEGKLTELTGSIRNYLFGIGKFKLMERSRKSSRWSSMEELRQTETEWQFEGKNSDIHHQLELSEQQKQLRQMLASLGSPCREILSWFYYDRFSMEAICSRLGYKSSDVVKSQKARCMRKLRNRVSKKSAQDLQ